MGFKPGVPDAEVIPMFRGRAAGGEHGAALLEVIVSAVVLLIATGATLAVLDGSARSSGVSRDRLVASDLAEQELERLRGVSVRTLDGYTTTVRTVTVGQLGYTIETAVKSVNDLGSGASTCTSGTDKTADYFLLTVTVNRSAGTGTRPVVLRSLLAPKSSTTGYKGTLSVPFEDRNGTPVPGMVVSATGPSSGSATSGGSGCAVFSYYPPGTYALSYNRTGWVTPAGQTGAVTTSGIVSIGQTNITGVQRYDQAGRVDATVRTKAAPGAGLTSAKAATLSLSTTGAGAGTGLRQFPASPASGAATISATGLFPFTEGYAAFAGSCAVNDPTRYGQPAQTVDVAPGGTSSVDVFVPTVTMTAPTSTVKLSTVVATDDDADCTQKLTTALATAATTASVQLPYGRWAICAEAGSDRYQRTITTGREPTVFTFTAGERTTGSCP